MDNKLQPLKNLLKIQEFYINEANKCKDANANFAGCVMLGSALESAILLMIALYPEELEQAYKIPKWNKIKKPPIEWSLSLLLDVARDSSWLPSRLKRSDVFDSPDKGLIGDYVRVIHEIRNLVHPGRYLRNYPELDITREHFDFCYEIISSVFDSLNNKITDSIKRFSD